MAHTRCRTSKLPKLPSRRPPPGAIQKHKWDSDSFSPPVCTIQNPIDISVFGIRMRDVGF